jgi:hypothetical protein
MSQPFSFEKEYGAKVETPRPLKVSEPAVIEGYTAAELVTLYNTMTDGEGTRRKYDMDNHVSFSRYHPEYRPDTSEKLIRDSEDIINQQMMTMGMTVAATASLAIIVFMITSTAASSSQ